MTRFLIILFAVFICLPPSSALSRDPVGPLPAVDENSLRVIEGQSFCSAGYGVQKVLFSIEGNDVYSREDSQPYLPGSDLTQSPYLRIDCVFKGLFVSYSFIDQFTVLNDTVKQDDVGIDAVDFRYDVLLLGYIFGIIPHRLYVEPGIGYSNLQYTLGYSSGGAAGADKSETAVEGGAVVHLSFRYYLSAFVSVNWSNQMALNPESVVSYLNQLGLNFMVRFK